MFGNKEGGDIFEQRARKPEKVGLFKSWLGMMEFAIKFGDFMEDKGEEVDAALKRAGETLKASRSLKPGGGMKNFESAAKGFAVDVRKTITDYENRAREKRLESEGITLKRIIEIKKAEEKDRQLKRLEEIINQQQREQLVGARKSRGSVLDQEITDKLGERITAKLKNADEKKKQELLNLIDKLID